MHHHSVAPLRWPVLSLSHMMALPSISSAWQSTMSTCDAPLRPALHALLSLLRTALTPQLSPWGCLRSMRGKPDNRPLWSFRAVYAKRPFLMVELRQTVELRQPGLDENSAGTTCQDESRKCQKCRKNKDSYQEVFGFD